jgi:hypothetical protein
MIQLFMDRSKGTFDIAEIHNPSRRFLGGTSYVDLDPERVAMESGTLVIARYIGQLMSRFDRELLKYLHDHPLLPDLQELVGLQAQLPLGMLQTVLQS